MNKTNNNDTIYNVDQSITNSINELKKIFEGKQIKKSSDGEVNKENSFNLCTKLISDAVFRYERCEECNKSVSSSNHELLTIFLSRRKTYSNDTFVKLLLSDMTLEEVINFINKIMSIITTDMMMFPEYALCWDNFLHAFIDILEDPYRMMIINFRLLNQTLCNLKKSNIMSIQSDFDGDINYV